MTTQKRRPYYDRLPPEEAPDINFTPRDKDIIEAIYRFDGILTDQQITRLFFNSTRRMKARMSLLFHAGYVNRFSRKQRNAYDFMLYYLDERGIAFLCDVWGKTEKELRPRYKDEQKHLIAHDVRLNDVRIAVLDEIERLGHTRLLDWISSREFAVSREKVTYLESGGTEKTRQINPDWYFHIETADEERQRELRYFVELDNNTETNVDILVDKIRPFLAYRNSKRFTERFGDGGVRYLFVTTTSLKVRNLKRVADEVGAAAKICCFTTYKKATTPGAFFTQPIWYRATIDEPLPLLSNHFRQDA